MTLNFKKTRSLLFFIATMLFISITNAQSTQSSVDANTSRASNEVSCEVDSLKQNKATSGCLPSSCRGVKTKFGEAKVISNLRTNLISLKAGMEKSNTIKFDPRAYDIHDIIGTTDDESLQIIIREIKLIEQEVSNKTDVTLATLSLPKNKAKQIAYLDHRITTLKKFL
ncbi:hypothetical protein [Spongiivirga citrea]|uniref:Secreted protein n=1 Tax=Spongiivirga citrea TaxID=1481457 RepID=A0A6M0CFE4_9FLAO|nr:hypothetical protein [Spongiivirga citrea]NER16565.1 hypothetical protein [Spongiivirga citrea]